MNFSDAFKLTGTVIPSRKLHAVMRNMSDWGKQSVEDAGYCLDASDVIPCGGVFVVAPGFTDPFITQDVIPRN